MNCSYRILKNVHIGERVRKTKDKKTVPFDNEPMKDMKIEAYGDQGFHLSHPSLPKSIWLDFPQLPLTDLTIEKGIIKDELTFVESLIRHRGITSMVLIRTETFDYLELLDDKKQKEETKKYSPKELTPGERIMSCLCRDGTVMVYLGTFGVADNRNPYDYYGGYGSKREFEYHYIHSTPWRAFFAIKEDDGTYRIKDYPITNKEVVEVYKESDKGNEGTDKKFLDEDENLKFIRYSFHYETPEYHRGYHFRNEIRNASPKFDFIKVISRYGASYPYVQKGRGKIRENAMEYFKENFTMVNNNGTPIKIFSTEKEYKEDQKTRSNGRSRW